MESLGPLSPQAAWLPRLDSWGVLQDCLVLWGVRLRQESTEGILLYLGCTRAGLLTQLSCLATFLSCLSGHSPFDC